MLKNMDGRKQQVYLVVLHAVTVYLSPVRKEHQSIHYFNDGCIVELIGELRILTLKPNETRILSSPGERDKQKKKKKRTKEEEEEEREKKNGEMSRATGVRVYMCVCVL